MRIVNWRPGNILEAVNCFIPCKDGKVRPCLDERGWHLYFYREGDKLQASEAMKGVDVWTACRVLNEHGAIFDKRN